MARLPIPGDDNGTWGQVLNDFLSVEHNTNGTLKSSGSLAGKADDNSVVHLSGNETVAGIKSFASSPVVPTPSGGTQAANKSYVDSVVGGGAADATTSTNGLVRLAGDLGGVGTDAAAPIISAGAITNGKIANGAVGTTKIATGAVTSNEIADATITNADIAVSAAIAKTKLAALNIVDGDVTGISESKVTGLTSDLAGKQPLSGDLTAISGLSPANDDLLQRKAGAWTNRTPAQVKTDFVLTKTDVGLANVPNIDATNRANHTGTQLASTISDFTEASQDAIGGALTDTNTIDFTYNDGLNQITADAKTQMSLTSDASGLKLSGDATAPGNTKYYGTNGSGTKGYYDVPTTGESNTASNVGAGGVGIFKQKSGVDLQFKNVNAGSSKITITNDTTNSEIDVDVTEANLTLTNLGGNLAESRITNLTTDLAAKASNTITITAGTGLTGGGDLTANRTLAANFGVAAGTIAQGNDSRITGAEQTANKSTAGGYAALDIGSKVPTLNLGGAGADNTKYLRGDQTWQTLDKTAVGLANVDNTSDASKPVSTATQTALNGKISTSVATTKGDLLAATASATVTRLGVGSDGQVLTASSAAATGLAWTTVAAGGNTHTVATKTGNYTLTGSDEIILADATTGVIVATLPTAVGNTNQYTVKKTDSSVNTVTIATTASQTIDGATTAVIKVQYASVSVVSNGSNWFII